MLKITFANGYSIECNTINENTNFGINDYDSSNSNKLSSVLSITITQSVSLNTLIKKITDETCQTIEIETDNNIIVYEGFNKIYGISRYISSKEVYATIIIGCLTEDTEVNVSIKEKDQNTNVETANTTETVTE